jgi:hypothetical protein
VVENECLLSGALWRVLCGTTPIIFKTFRTLLRVGCGPAGSDSDIEDDRKVTFKKGNQNPLKSGEGMKRDSSMLWSAGEPWPPRYDPNEMGALYGVSGELDHLKLEVPDAEDLMILEIAESCYTCTSINSLTRAWAGVQQN